MTGPHFAGRGQIPKPPPILRDLFPNTAKSIRLTPAQSIAWVKKLAEVVNRRPELPMRVNVIEHSPYRITLDFSVNVPALNPGDH